MTSTGRAPGTVRLWMDDEGWGVIDSPELPGSCHVEAAVVDGLEKGGVLRAGQVVEVEWSTPGPAGYACLALRVEVRGDLQTTPGG
jgi:hypothetical protein